MAKALQACGDYKVVERFTPRRDWPEHLRQGAESARWSIPRRRA